MDLGFALHFSRLVHHRASFLQVAFNLSVRVIALALVGILWPLFVMLRNIYRDQISKTQKIHAITDDAQRRAQEARQAAKDAPKTFAKVK